MILDLKWEEISEGEGGGFKAETPIGDYQVWESSDGGMCFAELWDGPDKLGQIIHEHPPSILAAKNACLAHFNDVYRKMSAMHKRRPNPADGPMHPKYDKKVS